MAAALLLASLLAATAPELSYRVWTTDDGLAQGSVYALEQTPDGYLWIATLDGLVRFDGATMTTFNRSEHPALGSNRILALQVGGNGDLWIGTEDGGVARLSNGAFHTFGASEGLPDRFVPALATDASATWALTGRGLARFDGTRWSVSDEGGIRPGEQPIAYAMGLARPGGVRLLEHGRLVDYTLPAGADLRRGFVRDPRGASWLLVGTDALLCLERDDHARRRSRSRRAGPIRRRSWRGRAHLACDERSRAPARRRPMADLLDTAPARGARADRLARGP